MAKAKKKESSNDAIRAGVAKIRGHTFICAVIVREQDARGMPLPRIYWGDKENAEPSKRLFEEAVEMYRKNQDAWG
jgi:hypothetical protein